MNLRRKYSLFSALTSSTYRNVDGTGWIPVNFTEISTGNPLSVLPVDPVNSASSEVYYTYTSSSTGLYELSALMESSKYNLGGPGDVVSTDGGKYPDIYEVGTNLTVLPVDRYPKLAAYWSFDEESGSTVYDESINGNNGILYGGYTWEPASYCIGGSCILFNGSSGYINVPESTSLKPLELTVDLWFQMGPSGWWSGAIMADQWNGGSEPAWYIGTHGPYASSTSPVPIDMTIGNETTEIAGDAIIAASYLNSNSSVWNNLALTFDGSTVRSYLNGVLINSASATIAYNGTDKLLISQDARTGSNYWPGLLDNIRVYNTALSTSQIQAIYNAEKP